jgi:hypothetical protein
LFMILRLTIPLLMYSLKNQIVLNIVGI